MSNLTLAAALFASWITYLVLVGIYRGETCPWVLKLVQPLKKNPSLLQSCGEISWSSNDRWAKTDPHHRLRQLLNIPLQLWYMVEGHSH